MQPASPVPMPGMAYPPPGPSPLWKAGVVIGAILVILGGVLVWAGYMWALVFPPQNPSPGTARLMVGILFTGGSPGSEAA